jgi:hypothetical protein
LRALQEAEIRQIEKAGIRHLPTIGEIHVRSARRN